jgi:hypothetical protein
VKEGKAIKDALKDVNGSYSDSSFYGIVDVLMDLFYWNDDNEPERSRTKKQN